MRNPNIYVKVNNKQTYTNTDIIFSHNVKLFLLRLSNSAGLFLKLRDCEE